MYTFFTSRWVGFQEGYPVPYGFQKSTAPPQIRLFLTFTIIYKYARLLGMMINGYETSKWYSDLKLVITANLCLAVETNPPPDPLHLRVPEIIERTASLLPPWKKNVATKIKEQNCEPIQRRHNISSRSLDLDVNWPSHALQPLQVLHPRKDALDNPSS